MTFACTLPNPLRRDQLQRSSSRPKQTHALRNVVDLYDGDLLPGCYDEWIAAPRERLRQAFLEALQQLVDAYEHDFEVAVVITDDSDLAEPINIVRRRLNHNVTVLSPRGQSRTLSRVATKFWQITVANLAASQFPPTLTDSNGVITKPPAW